MPTWPTRKIDDTLSGDGSKGLGSMLHDRDDCAISRGQTAYFTEVTHGTNTLTTVRTFRVRMPPWAKVGAVVNLMCEVGHDAGTAYAGIKVGSDTGAEQSEATSYAFKTLTVTLTASQADTSVDLEVQARNGGSGSAKVRATDVACNFWVTP